MIQTILPVIHRQLTKVMKLTRMASQSTRSANRMKALAINASNHQSHLLKSAYLSRPAMCSGVYLERNYSFLCPGLGDQGNQCRVLAWSMDNTGRENGHCQTSGQFARAPLWPDIASLHTSPAFRLCRYPAPAVGMAMGYGSFYLSGRAQQPDHQRARPVSQREK